MTVADVDDEHIAALVRGAPVFRDPTFARIRDPPVSKNIVCTINYGTRIDLRLLVQRYLFCEYDSTRFAALIARMMPAKSCMLMFGTGKCVLTGCRTLHEVEVCVRKYAKMLRETGHNVTRYSFSLTNHVMTASVPHALDLQRMHENNRGITDYDPDSFPGLIFKLADLKVAVVCFESGKFNIVGFKNYQEGLAAHDYVMSIIPRFRLVNVLDAGRKRKDTKIEKHIVKELTNPNSKFSVRSTLEHGDGASEQINLVKQFAQIASVATTRKRKPSSATNDDIVVEHGDNDEDEEDDNDDDDDVDDDEKEDDYDDDDDDGEDKTPSPSKKRKMNSPVSKSPSPSRKRTEQTPPRFRLGEISRKERDVRLSQLAPTATTTTKKSAPTATKNAGGGGGGGVLGRMKAQQTVATTRTIDEEAARRGREIYLQRAASLAGARPMMMVQQQLSSPPLSLSSSSPSSSKLLPSSSSAPQSSSDRFKLLHAQQQAAAAKRAVDAKPVDKNTSGDAAEREATVVIGYKRALTYTSEAIDVNAIRRMRERQAAASKRKRVIIN